MAYTFVPEKEPIWLKINEQFNEKKVNFSHRFACLRNIKEGKMRELLTSQLTWIIEHAYESINALWKKHGANLVISLIKPLV